MAAPLPNRRVTRPIIDIHGQQFGEWTVIGRDFDPRPGAYWRVRCSCGQERVVRGTDLRCGKTKHCGHSVGWNMNRRNNCTCRVELRQNTRRHVRRRHIECKSCAGFRMAERREKRPSPKHSKELEQAQRTLWEIWNGR